MHVLGMIRRAWKECALEWSDKGQLCFIPTAASKQNFRNNAGVRTESCVQSRIPTLVCNRGRCKRHPCRGRRPRTTIHDPHCRRKSRKSPRVEGWCRPPAQELRLQGAKSSTSPFLHNPLLNFRSFLLVRIRPTGLRSAWRVKPNTSEASYLLLMVGNISR